MSAASGPSDGTREVHPEARDGERDRARADAGGAPLLIESMTPADLDEVDFIERVSFKEPWPAQTFADELTKPFARVDVARLDGRVIGFSNYWIVAGETSLLAIAIHPDQRRRGHAAQLLARVVEASRRAGCERVFLEVRRGNQPAIALYQRHGFSTLHFRTGYYADGEDALVMSIELVAPP